MLPGENSPQKFRIPFGLELSRCEGVVLLLTLTVLFVFHLMLQMNVDAFWRDEVASLVLARYATWGEVWTHLVTDSFPGLWIIILRGWKFIGMGAGDWWLRLLGMVLSAGVFAALLASARRLKTGAPVLAVALLGGIPAMFYWGDSLRAYALACVLIGLLFGWVWSYVEKGGLGLGIATGAIAVLAAQSNYQNSYLIFGICVSGALVAALNRKWGRSAAVLGMGAAAAASLLPYLGIIAAYQVAAPIQKGPKITPWLVMMKFSEGFDGVESSLLPVLLFLVLLVILAPIGLWIRRSQPEGFGKSLYAAAALLVSGASCYVFITIQGFPTNCWYYLPILTVAVLSIETTFSLWKDDQRLRWIRLGLAAAVFISSLPALWHMANLRRTSMDLAAFQIAKQAEERDLVLIHPFFEADSFYYYYKGRAPWSLLPIVPEDQRLDCMNAMMKLSQSETPLAPTFDQISKTLQNGGKVWVVNGLPILPEGIDLAKFEKARRPMYGWQTWAMAIGSYLQKHATSGTVRKIETELPVCHFENVQVLFVFSGWKE